MKTIIHLELSDLERGHLGHGHLVTRKEVTELVNAFIKEQVGETKATPCKQEPEKQAPAFIPSRGDEAYLTQPKDPGIAAACSRILDDAATIEQFAWDTIERNRK